MNKLFALQSDHPLFRYFTDEERQHIEKIGELVTIVEGDYLIGQAEEDSRLFAVDEGILEIIASRGGAETVVATVGGGDVLGEVSFIDDSPRSTSVRAAEKTIVRAWDKKTLSEALAFDPQLLAKFSVAMCELLVERLRDTARRV
ncbi:MAG: cyclic nucleotide-binding protein [Acidobacteria bacterium]|nr:cyclic nucleotide-binding protein [Acidobacteriota bacterium]